MAKSTPIAISMLDIEPVMAVVETASVVLQVLAERGSISADADAAVALQDAMDGLLAHLREERD